MTAWRTRALELLALTSFAILQPLLSVLERHPEFLAAHALSGSALVAVVFGLALVPPLGLLGLELAGRRLHEVIRALLVALVALPVLHVLGLAAPLAALALGVAAAAALRRFAGLRTWLRMLSAAPAIFLLVFFASDSVRPLLRDAGDERVLAAPIVADVPIVMVVFDEFPLASILDERGEIDAVRFPSFARLARTSTWFPNATAVDWRTLQAIASLVTGRRPGERPSLPTVAEHPRNLFTLLADAYEFHVVEDHGQFAPHGAIESAAITADRALRTFGDLAVLHAHLVLPPGLRGEWLPPIDEDWRDFVPGLDDVFDFHGSYDRLAMMRRFIAGIESDAERPGLHYLHALFPHKPWRYLPSGSSYHPNRGHSPRHGHVWLGHPWLLTDSWQRHLLQVGLADRVVGELLDRLEETGLAERALLIVTADHGISFWPRESARDFARSRHPADILGVPLFVRRPDQTEGAVDWRNAESIDVLPTIVDVLGVGPGWDFDGCSLFDPACPERPHKAAWTKAGRGPGRPSFVRRFPANNHAQLAPTLVRKHALFGSGVPEIRPSPGAYTALVGRRVADLVRDPTPLGRVRLQAPSPPWWVPIVESPVHVRIAGLLDLDEPPDRNDRVFVSVSVDGEVAAVVPVALTRQGWRIAAMLPEGALRLDERPDVHLVSGPPEAPVLQPLRGF